MRFIVIPALSLLLAAYQPACGQAKSAKTKATARTKVASAKKLSMAPTPTPSTDTAAIRPAQAAPADTSGAVARLAEGNAGTGKQLFNVMLGCSHCHGINSVGHGDNRNLRELKKRRGAEWDQVFAQVMKEGRSGTAMPPWAHLSTKQVTDIKAFILSIQEE